MPFTLTPKAQSLAVLPEGDRAGYEDGAEN
jgi:hypothetical protein